MFMIMLKINFLILITILLLVNNFRASTFSFTYFNSISWISRDGKMSLSLSPKSPFFTNKELSWQEAIRFFQYYPMCRQETNKTKFMSMYNQYACHVDFVRGIKTPWNIEP